MEILGKFHWKIISNSSQIFPLRCGIILILDSHFIQIQSTLKFNALKAVGGGEQAVWYNNESNSI